MVAAVGGGGQGNVCSEDRSGGCGKVEDEEYEEPLFRIKSQLTYERGNSHSQFSFDEVAKENTNRENTAREEENGKDRKSTATGAQRGWETPCFEGTEGIGIRCDMRIWRDSSANDLGNVACRFITAEARTVERECGGEGGEGGEGSELDKELKSSRLQQLQIPASSQDANNESDAEVRILRYDSISRLSP